MKRHTPNPSPIASYCVKEILDRTDSRTDRNRALDQMVHSTGLSRATLLRKARAAGYKKKGGKQ